MAPASQKFISSLLVGVFIGLIILSAVSSHILMMNEPSNCHGFNCGLVEHVACHAYLIPNKPLVVVTGQLAVVFTSQKNSLPDNLISSPLTPPPELFS